MSLERSLSKKAVKLVSSPKIVKRALKNNLTVLLYHDVRSQPDFFSDSHKLNVAPDIFELQMEFVKNNFHIVTPDEVMQGDYPTPACLVTFDDGLRGYLTEAFPIMEKLGIPSLIFLNSGPVLGEVFWSGIIHYLDDHVPEFKAYLGERSKDWIYPNYLNITTELIDDFFRDSDFERVEIEKKSREFYGDFISEADLNDLQGSGLVWFGNHLYNHYNSARLSRDEFIENYKKNHEYLSGYSNYSGFFSYPFGQPHSCFTNESNGWLKEMAPLKAFTAYPALNPCKEERWLMHRVVMTDQETSEKKIWESLAKSAVRSYVAGRSSLLLDS